MSLLGPLLVHGNGLERRRAGRRQRDPLRAVRLPRAVPIKVFEKYISGWTIVEDDQERTVPADTMLHLAWWSPLGPLGVSPLQQLGVTLSIEDAAQRYQRSLFKNGARPPSAITATRSSSASTARARQRCSRSCARTSTTSTAAPTTRQARAAAARARLEAGRPHGRRGGADRPAQGRARGGLRRLPDPAAVPRDPRPRDVQQHPDAARGRLHRRARAAARDDRADDQRPARAALLREDDVFVEFDFAGVLRGDRLKEMQTLREAIGIGLMTRNEGRSVLNMPQSDQDGMDDFYFEANNMGRVGDTARATDRGRRQRRRPTTGDRPRRPGRP
jgi:hypothetical protein